MSPIWPYRVNIPKEIMEIPGFPFPEEWNKSYITRQQCLEYLNMFADHFNLRKHIRVFFKQLN